MSYIKRIIGFYTFINKYITHIRFLNVSRERARGKQTTVDIPFKMIMCSFDPVMA